MLNNELKFKLSKIPKKHGCYLWKNKYGEIIYVGKANNIYSRVRQYFLKSKDLKTNKLVQNIYDVDYIVVNNENEALILENNLIKKYQPKYNILLKDGTFYPYIVLTNEKYPRLIYTRDLKKYKGTYYGPFAQANSNKYSIYNLLLQLFPLRKCNIVPKQKCLYYDIKQCLGPCINKINDSEWLKIKKDINEFFKGNYQNIIKDLKQKELSCSESLDYEQAKKYFDLINSINELERTQNINLSTKKNIDVLGYCRRNNLLSIVLFMYVNGKLLAKNEQIVELYNNNINETITNYLIQYYDGNNANPSECYLNIDKKQIKELKTFFKKITFINPTKGKFKDILLNAINNAKTYLKSNYHIFLNNTRKKEQGFNDLKKIIGIDNLSLIHVFDMSNLFGEDKVGCMIALENGEFNKNLYRKFIIKDLSLSSDTEYMYEVIKRQYHKMIDEKSVLPNLIIVDGSKQQVNSTIKALKELKLDSVIPVIGLAKNNKHKTHKIVTINDQYILEPDSFLYFFLFNIQEEIHRYTINFFRKRNIDSKFKSKLKNIKGLGTISINKLLKHYDNVANIASAPIEEISQFVNKKIAKKIKEELND